MALWDARFKKKLNSKVNDFNSSIKFDSKMYKEDIRGSIAHNVMLEKQNIINKNDSKKIEEELKKYKKKLKVES